MTDPVARYGDYEVWDGDEPHITDGDGTIISPSPELLCAVEAALHLATTREHADSETPLSAWAQKVVDNLPNPTPVFNPAPPAGDTIRIRTRSDRK